MSPEVPGPLEGIPPLAWAAIVVVLTLGASVGVRVLMRHAFDRGEGDRNVGKQLGRFVSLVVFTLGIVYALNVAGVRIGPLLGALGVGGIAIAFAAQDVLQNLLAGLLIQLRRPFRVGDQVTVLDYEGTVLDVDLRAVRLLTYDGLDVVLPNAEVLRAPIVNHTRTPQRRTTLMVGVRYDTDLELARSVLLSATRSVSSVLKAPPPSAWVMEFADSSINIAVMYWHGSDIASLWRTRNGVAIAVKKALDAHDIEIPFPQRVLWYGDTGAAGQPRPEGTEAG